MEGGGQQQRTLALEIHEQQPKFTQNTRGVQSAKVTPNKGKKVSEVPEPTLHDFPILCSVPVKNGFEVLHKGCDGS